MQGKSVQLSTSPNNWLWWSMFTTHDSVAAGKILSTNLYRFDLAVDTGPIFARYATRQRPIKRLLVGEVAIRILQSCRELPNSPITFAIYTGQRQHPHLPWSP